MRIMTRRSKAWRYWIPIVLIPLLGITYLLLPKEDRALNPGTTGLTRHSEYHYGDATIKIKGVGFSESSHVTAGGPVSYTHLTLPTN